MTRLIGFELFKVYGKRRFALFLLVLLACNLFLLGFLNTPNEFSSSLSAYRALSDDLCCLSETEKVSFIAERKALLDTAKAIRFSNGDAEFSAEELKDYNSKAYLRYTDAMFQESDLIDEVYEEMLLVSDYDRYLTQVAQAPERTQGISILASDENDFANRNLEKSSEDHSNLTSENIRFVPSRKVTMAMETPVTDILILLSVLLLVGTIINEEKEKALFSITRATQRGLIHNILAKLLALFIHCVVFSALMYGSNLLYSYFTVGGFDMSAGLQSVSNYIESDLSISLGCYIALSVFTKAALISVFGAFLTAIAVVSERSILMPLFGIGLLAVNFILYSLIPAISSFSILKYLSFFSILKTEKLYGGYLNLNIFGYAVSWRMVSLICISLFAILTIVVTVVLFCKGTHLTAKKSNPRGVVLFRPHGSLFLHEGYKILIMNKALPILIIFSLMIGYSYLSKNYTLSFGEEYYQNIMLRLEGELSDDKLTIIASEKERFAEANKQIDGIDDLVASGELSELAGDNLKMKWQAVLQFKPYFDRVLQQYEHIKENGGVFVYDTGYRYLFGSMDTSYLMDYTLLSLALIFAFGNVFPTECTQKSWNLLSATKRGKRAIIKRKVAVCIICVCVMAVLPWIFRLLAIGEVYPLHLLSSGLCNLPAYFESSVSMPIWSFVVCKATIQVVTMLFILTGVLLISSKQQSQLTAVCISLLVFALPAILALIGISFMKSFSVFSMYCLP